MQPSGPEVPALIAGKYRVSRAIGQGGMGVVVEARHTTLDERVAIKMLLPAYAAHPEATPRFIREAKAAVRIKSAHVARVSDVGTTEDGRPYMVMEYLEGCDAGQLLRDVGPLPISDAVELVIQACDAIAEAHGIGIVHRDLKPANLFVTRHTDGSPFVKVLDFGISKMVEEGVDALTRSATTVGSALYMSPEQMKQSRSVDHRTDIYALGITLFELLAHRHPFMAETYAALCVEVVTGTPTPLCQLRPDVPEALARVIERAYARDREHRYSSIAELMVALAPWAPESVKPLIERQARAAGLVQRGAQLPIPAATPAPSGEPTGAQFASATTNRRTGTGERRTGLSALLAVGFLIVVVGVIGVGLAVRTQLASPEPPASATGTPVVETAVVAAAPPPVVEPSSAPPPSASAATSASAEPPAPAPRAAVRRPTSAQPAKTPPDGPASKPPPPDDPYSVR
jgi:serine/threonine-protein kinase